MNFALLTVAPTLAFALAVVATIAYVLGKRAHRFDFEFARNQRAQKRANTVIRELELISRTLRHSLAQYHANVLQFRDRVAELGLSQDPAALKQLSQVTDQMLKPTIQLSSQIGQAYDELRQQAQLLTTSSADCTDALTGVSNRRAMEETLQSMLAIHARYRTGFSMAILDIDHFKQLNQQRGSDFGDQILGEFARLLEDSARQTDIVARFGGEEFVVLMPETDLAGACAATERFRAQVEARLPITVTGGVTEAVNGDCMQSLLSRADTALYSAKSAGRNCVFRHCGQNIERFTADPAATTRHTSTTSAAANSDQPAADEQPEAADPAGQPPLVPTEQR